MNRFCATLGLLLAIFGSSLGQLNIPCPEDDLSNPSNPKVYKKDAEGHCIRIRDGLNQADQFTMGCDEDEYILDGTSTKQYFNLQKFYDVSQMFRISILWTNAQPYTPPGESRPIGYSFNGESTVLPFKYRESKAKQCVEFKLTPWQKGPFDLYSKFNMEDCSRICPIACIKPLCVGSYILNPVSGECERITRPDLSQAEAVALCDKASEVIGHNLTRLIEHTEAGGGKNYWMDTEVVIEEGAKRGHFEFPDGTKVLNKAGKVIKYTPGETHPCIEYSYQASSKTGKFAPRSCDDPCPVLCVSPPRSNINLPDGNILIPPTVVDTNNPPPNFAPGTVGPLPDFGSFPSP